MDTLRLLFETRDVLPEYEVEELPGWRFGAIPALGLTTAEGHPAGKGVLASAAQVADAADRVRTAVDARVGVLNDRGVSRSDQTVTTRFHREQEARAFLTGMAAVQLPRTQTTRRGHPVQSISWTAPNGKRILRRCYDKGLELGGEAFKDVRLEDQRRYPSGRRVSVDQLDGDYLRGRFEAAFGSVRKAVAGVKAATFPVVAQALADEFRYGYRSWQEVERLAGSLVLLSGGVRRSELGRDTKEVRIFDRRRRELRDAGYVVVEDLAEVVEVELGDVIERALEAEWA